MEPRPEEIHGSKVSIVTGVESTNRNGEKVDVHPSEEADSTATAVGEETGEEVYTKAENIGRASGGGRERVCDLDAGVSFADLTRYVARCEQA